MNKMKRMVVAILLASATAVGAQTLCPCAVYRWYCVQAMWPGIIISEYDWFTTDSREEYTSNMGFWWTTCRNLGVAYYE
jgi:hypothetical protein